MDKKQIIPCRLVVFAFLTIKLPHKARSTIHLYNTQYRLYD